MKKKMFIASLSLSVAVAAAFTVTPAHAIEDKVDFKDVPKTHQMYHEIMTMRDQGIIHGYEDNTFKPSQAITRTQVAALFVRSLDLQPVREGKEFKDVPKTSVHYQDVQAVYQAGIFDGKPDGTFGAADKLTRAQMSKVLVNAFDLKLDTGYIFKDVNEKHWFKDYVATLYTNGITTGSNGNYMPDQSVTRSQYAAFLYRSLNPEKISKPSKPLQPTPPVVEKPEPKPPVVKPQPAFTPPGAKFIKEDKYYRDYSYKKNLPGGGAVYEVFENKTAGTFLINFKSKYGESESAVYDPKRDVISFLMVSASPVTNEGLEELYDIGRTFESYKNKK